MSLVSNCAGITYLIRCLYHGININRDFTPDQEGCPSDTVNNFPYTKAIYQFVDPNHNLCYKVPILYEKKTKNIVNESSEIIRFFNLESDEFVKDKCRGFAIVLRN